MPELPEVESARSVIERNALHRTITDVDDSDTYVCRPHPPGELRSILRGGELIGARRQGKSIWCEVSGRTTSVTLGIHLGMSGKIVVADADGSEVDGGDYWEGRRVPGDYRWSRFALTFADGGRMLLVDPRRLGRVRLDPPVDRLGPDAESISAAEFHELLSPARTLPVKALLLDQHRIAGIGNLLADEILWRARIYPGQPVSELTAQQQTRLIRATHTAIGAAVRKGGVHTLEVVPHRHAGGLCPRDGAPMVSGKFGGRTTWWCSVEQAQP